MLKLLSFRTIFCRRVKNITKSSSAKNYRKILVLLLSLTFVVLKISYLIHFMLKNSNFFFDKKNLNFNK